jgi:hypothetical protein
MQPHETRVTTELRGDARNELHGATHGSPERSEQAPKKFHHAARAAAENDDPPPQKL